MGLASIPEELRQRRQWVLWKLVNRDGDWTKLPFQASGSMAKSNDPETWCSFEEAVEHMDGYSGVGFMFSADDPYCGIDLDGCRDPKTGEVAAWAKEIVMQLASYAEVSPSQTGVKVWVRAKWGVPGHKILMEDAPKMGDKTPAIEIYDRTRYFAVTGQRLRGLAEIADRQAEVDALAAKYFVATPSTVTAAAPDFRAPASVFERARKYLAKMPVSVSGQNGHNAAFHAACVLILGFGLDEADALSLLAEWNAGCQPPWSERELEHKIRSASKQSGDRGYLRNVEPRNFDRVPVPQYKAPEPKPEVKTTTLREAALSYVATIRAGTDALVTSGIPDLDFAVGGGFAAGELVLLAARPSHGKSSVALQMVHHWNDRGLPVVFVSEEMSALALGKRALMFASDIPTERWTADADALEMHAKIHFNGRAECMVVEQCRTADAAADAIREAKENRNITCAVVDYAQLLGSKGRSRYEQVTNTSIALRQVASETGVVLLALCQLGREIENRTPLIPHMSDLKDTGQLEQDADVIVFLVWPHRLNSQEDPHKYQLFVAKNRNRAINRPAFTVRFEPSRQRLVHEDAQVNDPF